MTHKVYRMARAVGKSTDIARELNAFTMADQIVRYWRRWARARAGLPPADAWAWFTDPVRFEARKKKILEALHG